PPSVRKTLTTIVRHAPAASAKHSSTYSTTPRCHDNPLCMARDRAMHHCYRTTLMYDCQLFWYMTAVLRHQGEAHEGTTDRARRWAVHPRAPRTASALAARAHRLFSGRARVGYGARPP